MAISPIPFSVDSNFIRLFGYYVMNNDSLAKKCTDPVIKDNYRYYDTIKALYDLGYIKFYAVPNVYKEVSHHPFFNAFLDKYCTKWEIPENYKEKFDKAVSNLAYAYCRIEHPVTKRTALIAHYNPKVKHKTPSSDAYIIAQSSILGLSVLTHDEAHMIQSRNVYAKNLKEDIVKGVEYVNDVLEYNKFKSHNPNKAFSIPKPITPKMFCEAIKNKDINLFDISCPDFEFRHILSKDFPSM